eukprot:GGOE01005656.1.p1 GENE.GGOE01005656.1~~GGOE01005656.1.p1  ORF type:complete len:624 (-),score=203.42 GGOE01005656.1:648-2519(-)
MSYHENYEKLGSALAHMSERLRDLLAEAEEGALQSESWENIGNSWRDDPYSSQDTAAKLKDLIYILKQDQADNALVVDEEVIKLFWELGELLDISIRPDASMAHLPTRRNNTHIEKERPVISARACVVCHRDDRPGEQRKSGFKCLECIGIPSKLERSDVSFGVLEKAGTKSVDSYGTKSIDEYDLGDNVGKGSYGKVKTCRHKKSGQMYAMKIVDKRRLQKITKPGSQKTEFDKVMMEIEIMKSLQHPNVVKMYEVIDDPESGKVYLIMEYCSGGRIFDLEGNQEGMAKEQPERLKKYIVAIANGLDYLHGQRIYHRDLKPDNILTDASDHVKLTDFGVSTVTGEDGVLTQTEGTPAFNAPEEFDDKMHVAGDKADIWSFGVTVYCAAFGYLPFMGSSIQDIGEAIKTQKEKYPSGADPMLVDLLKKFLQKNPAKRITLKQVLEHPYLEDVRTVKGQAVETITCRIKTVRAEDTRIIGLDPELRKCDGLFLTFPQEDGMYSKGVQEMSEYIMKKGGVYQVVLPTPDSCTLFRPRSARRAALQNSHDRDMSFSFLIADSRSPCHRRDSPTLSGMKFNSVHSMRSASSSFLNPNTESKPEAFTDITVSDPVGETLLDKLGINLL